MYGIISNMNDRPHGTWIINIDPLSITPPSEKEIRENILSNNIWATLEAETISAHNYPGSEGMITTFPGKRIIIKCENKPADMPLMGIRFIEINGGLKRWQTV
jgi:hypothetical protein